MLKFSQRGFESGFLILCCLFSLGFIIFLLPQNLNFLDEPNYAAIPYRFILGDLPFVDEFHIIQTASMISVPLVKLFVLIKGNTEGILLYLRYAYFAYSILIGLVIFILLKRVWDWRLIFPACFLAVSYVPYGIPSFSYNTLSSTLFCVGLFVLWTAQRDSSRSVALLAGVVQGLAVFAYPTQFISLLYVLLVMIFLVRDKRIVLNYVAGAASVLLFFLFLLRNTPLRNFVQSYQYILTEGYDSVLAEGLRGYFFKLIGKLWLLPISLVIVWFVQRRKFIFELSLLLLPLWALCRGQWQAGLMVYFAFMAPLYLLAAPDSEKKSLFVWVWFPSVISAFVFVLTSDKGLGNLSTGLLAAGIVSACFLSSYASEKLASVSINSAVSLMIFGLLLAGRWQLAFPSPTMREIGFGPGRGMTIEADRADQLERLTRKIAAVENPRKRLFIYPMYPYGYLVGRMKPAAFSVNGMVNMEGLDYFLNQLGVYSEPLIIVKMIYQQPEGKIHPVIDGLVSKHFALSFSSRDFEVYQFGS